MKNKLFLLLFLLIKTLNIYPQIKITTPEELISIGLANSQTIKLNTEYTLSKMKNAKLSLSSFLPQLDFTWQEYDNININKNDTRNKTISMNLTQLLYDNGKSELTYLYNRENALHEYTANEQQIENYKLELTDKYFNYILTDEIIKIKKSLLNKTENDLKVIEYKYANGLALKSELIEYQINIKQIQNEIINYEKNQELNLINIKNSINISQNTDLIIKHTDLLTDNKFNSIGDKTEEITNKIISNNLQIKQLISQLEYQKKILTISNRFYFPSVYVSGGISFNGTSYPLTQPDYSVKLIFSFDSIPFNKTDISNEISTVPSRSKTLSNRMSAQFIPETNYFENKKLSKLSLKKTQESLTELKQKLTTETFEYINQHDSLLEQLKLYEETIKLMEEKLNISQYEAENGLKKKSDYINEQLELAQYRQNYIAMIIQIKQISSKLSLLTGVINLYE